MPRRCHVGQDLDCVVPTWIRQWNCIGSHIWALLWLCCHGPLWKLFLKATALHVWNKIGRLLTACGQHARGPQVWFLWLSHGISERMLPECLAITNLRAVGIDTTKLRLSWTKKNYFISIGCMLVQFTVWLWQKFVQRQLLEGDSWSSLKM
jgi:hypothetical protein